MSRVVVNVMPKPEILDPQGKAVTQSLHQLGFQDVMDTRVSKYIELVINETDKEKAKAEINSICDKLLANPNTETYDFSLETMEN